MKNYNNISQKLRSTGSRAFRSAKGSFEERRESGRKAMSSVYNSLSFNQKNKPNNSNKGTTNNSDVNSKNFTKEKHGNYIGNLTDKQFNVSIKKIKHYPSCLKQEFLRGEKTLDEVSKKAKWLRQLRSAESHYKKKGYSDNPILVEKNSGDLTQHFKKIENEDGTYFVRIKDGGCLINEIAVLKHCKGNEGFAGRMWKHENELYNLFHSGEDPNDYLQEKVHLEYHKAREPVKLNFIQKLRMKIGRK